jgi:primase-polymerase (primpol)-like protein
VSDVRLQDLPLELRLRPQWCACGANKIPIDPKTKRAAKVDDPSTWGTFDQALAAGYKHVGYVLSADDPYSIIDLDNKVENPAPPDELERHVAIVR